MRTTATTENKGGTRESKWESRLRREKKIRRQRQRRYEDDEFDEENDGDYIDEEK